MLTIFSGLAQAESESISQNIKRGKEWSAAQGKVTFAYGNFLGYHKGPDGKPEIVPEEAAVVVGIYKRFLMGESFQQIARALHEQGIKTARGCDEWSYTSIRSILRSEKYKGDALLQKTYIEDCISKRVRVNRGELPQYYIENSHPAIIDRKTWDRAQEELARRAGKRKVKEVGTKTEQGKYSAKYALTELLICGDCGTPYRRCTWSRNGQKRIVWRCINRLDYGTKYCKQSPTLEESSVQNAIVKAIADLANADPLALETLKLHIKMGLQKGTPDESTRLRLRLNELNSALLELVAASTTDGVDNTAEDDGCNGISDEILTLQARLAEIEGDQKELENRSERLDEVFVTLEMMRNHLIEYDENTVRQLLECIKVIDRETLLVIFNGGIEREVKLS